MSDYFLYFRCWPGIIAGFPVEEFNSLRNDEIEPALNRFALDWLRFHRVEVRRLAKQRLVEIKRRRGVTASRPDGKWGPRPQRSEPRRSVRRVRSRDSLFRRVGDYAGWFVQKSLIFEDKESGEVKSAGPLVAVYHTSDREFAEKVVSTLNCDWSEYESEYPRRDYDPTSGALGKPLFHLEMELNPRFGLLHARDASKERFRLMMLQVANMKKNEPPDVLHPDLHLAVAQRAMRVIDEMEDSGDGTPSDPAPDAQQTDPVGGGDTPPATLVYLENPGPDPTRASYGLDCRSVNWYGQVFAFTPTQAACVKVLIEHYKHGVPELGEQAILECEQVESSQNRLAAVFNNGKHPAWGTMIKPGSTKGTFRLVKPGE